MQDFRTRQKLKDDCRVIKGIFPLQLNEQQSRTLPVRNVCSRVEVGVGCWELHMKMISNLKYVLNAK